MMISKKWLAKSSAILALVLLGLTVMGGCAPGPVPDMAPALDDAPPGDLRTLPQEPVEIKFSTWHPPASAECTTTWDPMLKELEARSNGRITTSTYYGGALGAGPDHFDIVADGLADMGYFTATWTPGRFPLSDVLSMPVFIGGKEIAVEIGNAMLEKTLYQEFPDVKMLSLNGCVQAYLWTTKPVKTLEDLRGLRIRSPGGLQTYMIEALGAEPIFMPLGEVYLSMETGVIDGIVTCPPLFYAFKLYEVANHAVVTTFGCVTEGVAMNLDSWNRLPEDLQAVVRETVANPYQLTGGLNVDVINSIMQKLADAGVNFFELPATEADRWNAIFAEEVVKKWVNEMEANGLPGKETLLLFKEQLDRHGVAFPAFPPEW